MVIVDMAGGASHPLGGIALVGMASAALRRSMLADQREAGQRVVEYDAGFPVIVVMALAAIGPELAGMRIVLCVARGAVSG